MSPWDSIKNLSFGAVTQYTSDPTLSGRDDTPAEDLKAVLDEHSISLDAVLASSIVSLNPSKYPVSAKNFFDNHPISKKSSKRCAPSASMRDCCL